MPNWVVSLYFRASSCSDRRGRAAIATIAAPSLELEGLEVAFRTETGLSFVVEGVSLRRRGADPGPGRRVGLRRERHGSGEYSTAAGASAMVRAHRLDVAGRDLLRMSERAIPRSAATPWP